MNDLRLYEALRRARHEGAALDADGVVAGLERVARWPLSSRVPWFGVIQPALVHPDGRVRQGALSALIGAGGMLALRAFVRGLDDNDAGVREAAARAMLAVAQCESMRLAHVVFHARGDVRAHAVKPLDDGALHPLAFFLLGDESLRAEVVERLAHHPMNLPKHVYPALMTFTERGDLPRELTVRLLQSLGWSVMVAAATGERERSRASVAMLVDDAHEVPTEAMIANAIADGDGLDRLLSVLAGVPDAASALWSFRALVRNRPAPVRRRAVAAARVVAEATAWTPALSGLAAALEPAFLMNRGVLLAVRKRAAAALCGVGNLPTVDDVLIRDLMGALVAGDSLELDVAAGVVHLAGNYEALVDAVSLEELLAAMSASPEQGAQILLVPASTKRGRKWLLQRIAEQDREMHAQLLAWTAALCPADKLHFIDDLKPWQAADLAGWLVSLEATHPLKANQARRLADHIAARLTHEASPEGVREALAEAASVWLRQGDPPAHRFGRLLVEQLASRSGGEQFALAMLTLDAGPLRRLVAHLAHLSALTYGAELALSGVLIDHPDSELATWAAARHPAPPPAPPVVASGVHVLTDAERDEVRDAEEHLLAGVLSPWRARPSKGLAEALALRPSCRTDAQVCAALLGCHDAPEIVAQQMGRYLSESPAFMERLDRMAVAWERLSDLPWLGSAWLWRWERHAFAVAGHMRGAPGQPLRVLQRALALPCRELRTRVWRAIGEAFFVWAARDVAKVHELVTGKPAEAFVVFVVEQLDTEVGEGAAKLYAALHRAGVAAARDAFGAVKGKLADLSTAARQHLERIVDTRGLGAPGRLRARRRSATEDELAAVRTSEDPEALAAWCRGAIPQIVQDAALRAIELGDACLDALAAVIVDPKGVPCITELIESIPLWPEHDALDRLRRAVDEPLPAETRFRLGMAFVERGEEGLGARAFAAVNEAGGESNPWFRPRDYQRLVERFGELDVAVTLAASPQAHAYLRAVPFLVERARVDADVSGALRAFLMTGRTRMYELRHAAAQRLKGAGDPVGFPLLLDHALDPANGYGRLFKGVDDAYVDAMVEGALYAGPRAVSEGRVLQMLDPTPRLAVGARPRPRAHADRRDPSSGRRSASPTVSRVAAAHPSIAPPCSGASRRCLRGERARGLLSRAAGIACT